MPPLPAVPRRGLARRVATRGWSRRRPGCSPGSASRPTARTGGAARSPRTTTPSTAPCSRSPAGPTPTSTRRSGCRNDASTCPAGRSSATGSTRFPDDAYPGPNLDWLHEMVRFFDRYLKGIENGWEREPARDLVRARVGGARAVPGGVARPVAGGGGVPGPGRPARVVPAGLGDGARLRRRWTRRPTAGVDAAPPPGDRGHRGRAVVGRGLAPQRPRARPAPGRSCAARPTRREPLEAARSDHRRPGGRPPAGRDDADRDLRRPPVRGVAGRGLVAGDHRGPEPDPSPIGHGPGAAGRRRSPRRSGSRSAPPATASRAGHRIRLTVLTGYWPVLWPSPFPGELRVHHGRRHAVAPRAAGPARRTVQDPRPSRRSS